MGLRDILRAVREYPAARTELETVRSELRQAQQALEQSQQSCESLWLASNEQQEYTNFLSHKAEALRDALGEFCPRLSTPEDMKRFYDTISPSMDAQGFTLYRMAKELTGIDVPSLFPYEDNRGMFELMEGHQLMDWLIAVRFQAVEWEIIPGSTYESATLLEVDTSTPEYYAFEKQLYGKVLGRMGFQDILAPDPQANLVTELKLYSPLRAEMAGGESASQLLAGDELSAPEFRDAILQGLKDELTPEQEKRGLMVYYDGLETVNEKVVSLFPSVEVIDGELYGVAVCQIKDELTLLELAELKEYCTAQYVGGWGMGYEQHPHKTSSGEMYVSFWRDKDFFILTKEELEPEKSPVRPPHQQKRGGTAR